MNDNNIKYPDITVQLSGEDGNAFAIVGRVAAELKRGGALPADVDKFVNEAFDTASYDELLQHVMKTVTVA